MDEADGMGTVVLCGSLSLSHFALLCDALAFSLFIDRFDSVRSLSLGKWLPVDDVAIER
jgi:hypothetical protein